MTTIALVDDDRNLLVSVAMALEAEGFVVQSHTDSRAALASFQRRMPDAAVLDLRMPGLDGFELVQRIRRMSQVPIIILTSQDGEVDEILGLRMGADDYITKPFSHRLLAERLRAVLRRGGAAADPDAPGGTEIVRGRLRMDPGRHKASWDGCEVALTVSEFLLLEALARRPGYVKSREQLMDAAYDSDVYVDDRTIDSHIKRMRKKFRAVDPDFDAIATLYGVGYRFDEG
jgi:two-component system response regulator ChvI